jgi:uroporphyrinogen-III synthase
MVWIARVLVTRPDVEAAIFCAAAGGSGGDVVLM